MTTNECAAAYVGCGGVDAHAGPLPEILDTTPVLIGFGQGLDDAIPFSE